MLELSPLFSTFGWPLEEESLIIHETTFKDDVDNHHHHSILDDQYHLPPPPPACQPQILEPLHAFTPCGTCDEIPNNSNKKLDHNASERHRRKKVNALYSSLRSLLPSDGQKNKLSVPATVARVIKYIPELQQEVEKLIQKKEELSAKFSRHEHRDQEIDHNHDQEERQMRKFDHSSLFAFSTTRINETEIIVQISTSKLHGNPLLMSDIIRSLEEDDLMVLIDVNTFESSRGIIFYNLHLQVERSYKLERAVLNEKILSLQEKELYYYP